jgi:bifunctional DNA-binding transcriptional regulator/antitoxin component of YhaV-PrlF toxin-antitoxin module
MDHTRYTIQLGERGRFVLPAEVRRCIHVDKGDFLVLDVEKDTLHLRKAEDVAQEARGLFRDLAPGRDLAAELIGDRRAEAAREEAESAVTRR